MPGRIFIESRPVTQDNPKIKTHGSDHLYLVYQDQYGKEHVIRGGQEDESASGFIQGLFGRAGPIIVEDGIEIRNSNDYRDPHFL